MRVPEVSVILPVFNGKRYLGDSIDSVLGQDYEDYELLVCDDGSSDDSVNIIRSRRDGHIKFFNNETNLGLFKTLNALIRRASGKFIRLWSQDDVMNPCCLKEEVEFFKIHPEAGFCYCARDIIDKNGNVIRKMPEDKTPDVISPALAAQIMFYYGSIAGNISTVMMKKDALDAVGLFREDMQVASDFEMWVRISAKYPIGFIRRPLIKLRSHSEQFSRKKGAGLLFMCEEEKIIGILLKRLPPEILSYAETCNRWHRHTQHINYMARCFMTGDFGTALQVYRHVNKIDNVTLAFFLWLFTINGRIFKKGPKFKV